MIEVDGGDTIRIGPIEIVAHLTPGHSPGGTTWTWRSCELDTCLNVVYADSQTPVSVGNYRFSDGDRADRFEVGLDVIESLSCDILLTPHPGASGLWDRVSERGPDNPDALVDST